jgi:hypothetical protein
MLAQVTLEPGALCADQRWSSCQILIAIFSSPIWCDVLGCAPLPNVDRYNGLHGRSLQQHVVWHP